jgi:hypothetical protein
MSWGQGREVVLRMIADGDLEHVPADEELANRILQMAVDHLGTAERESSLDPVMAYSALYDAARKALTALLQVQGLRPTRIGGHLAVLGACRAQLDPPLGKILRPLDRMRSRSSRCRVPGRHDGDLRRRRKERPAGCPGRR